MAFKMRGWSPFTKETRLEGPRNVGEETSHRKTMTKTLKQLDRTNVGEQDSQNTNTDQGYIPQTTTRADISTDITPQSQQNKLRGVKDMPGSWIGGVIPFVGEASAAVLKNLKKKK